MKKNGTVFAIKLEHVSGSIRVNADVRDTYWGVFPFQGYSDVISTLVTRINKVILAPKIDFSTGDLYSFKIAGYHHKSPNLVMEVASFHVSENEQLAVWFAEDFFSYNDSNNSGNHCVDIYVKFES